MRRTFLVGLVGAVGLAAVLIGCRTGAVTATADPGRAASPAASTAATTPTMDPTSAETARVLVERIGKSYSWLARSDGIFWAPWDCVAPPPPATYQSAATDGEHARKLYRLLLQSPDAYGAATGGPLAKADEVTFHASWSAPWDRSDSGTAEWTVFRETEQVVVKESWAPHECANETRITMARVGGKTYCLDQPKALFVMAKPRAKLPSDEGWIYGTFENGAVTSSGLVESCMGCHAKAPHGRLFGIPKQ